MVIGNQSLVATDKCLTRAFDVRVKLLENVYEIVCLSRLMYGTEIWGLKDTREEIDVIRGRLCKKV
jgi:hypothetical protein